MKQFFLLAFLFLSFASCQNNDSNNTDNDKPQNTTNNDSDASTAKVTAAELEKLILEDLKTELKVDNYQALLKKYEQFLVKDGTLASADGKGYASMLKEAAGSEDIFGKYILSSELQDMQEDDKIDFAGFLRTFDKFKDKVNALPEGTPLRVYHDVAKDLKENGNPKPSSVFAKLTEKLNEETLNKDFYQDYTFLFLFAMTM